LTTDLEQLNKLESSRKYLIKKFPILMKNYPESHVAIMNGKVVFAEPDLDVLLQKVIDKFGSTQGVLIDYITSKRQEIIV